MAGNERDLLNGKSGFEERLVPGVMKVKVVDVEGGHWRRKAVPTDRPL
jgi:hypothetical protein